MKPTGSGNSVNNILLDVFVEGGQSGTRTIEADIANFLTAIPESIKLGSLHGVTLSNQLGERRALRG